MDQEPNYALEEYKMLKEEAKSFTDQSFRDFQLFVTILAIFLAVIGASSKPNLNISPFLSYTITQIALFVFLIIQFLRLSYILNVRNHLIELEIILNNQLPENHQGFVWESEIVPKKISNRSSLGTHIQIAILLVYLLIFGFLCFNSIKLAFVDYDDSCFILTSFLTFIVLEIIFLFSCMLRIAFQFFDSEKFTKEQQSKKRKTHEEDKKQE